MSIYFFEIHFFGIIWRTSIWTNREINYEFKSIMDKGKNWMIDHVFAFHMKCDHPPRKTKVPALPPIPIDSQNAIVALSSHHFDTYLKYSSVVVFQCCMNCCSFRVQKKNFKWPYFLIYGTSCSTRGMCVFWKKISLSLSLTWITQSKS